MTVGVIYLFVIVRIIAIVAGVVTLNGTHREAERIRGAEAERKRVSA